MKLRFSLWLLSFLIIGMTAQLHGQVRKYSYHQLTEEKGLAQNFVYGLLQDARGFLWAGTGNGLSRYDGAEIKRFTTKDGLSGDFVTTAFRTSSGNLVFGHNQGGVSQFDGVSFNVLIPDTLQTKIVSITEDKEQNIWIATQSKGLIIIGSKVSAITGIVAPELEGQVVNKIAVQGEMLWVGTQEGLLLFRINGTSLTAIKHDILPLYTEVASILEHRNNPSLCWVGTAFQGIWLVQYNATKNRLELQRKIDHPDLSGDIVQAMEQDPEGDLWVGTRQHGVLHLNIGRDGKSIFKITSFSKRSGFPITSVNRLVIDRQGQVWASTMGDGLVRIFKEFFRYFPLAEKYGVTDVRSIVQRQAGYWVATDRGLFEIAFNAQSDEYTIHEASLLKEESILCLYTDRHQQTWVGTENKGVFVLSKGSHRLQPVSFGEDPAAIRARLFEEDLKGNMWISAMTQGVYVLGRDRKVINHLTTADRFIHNDINAIKADSKGNIWFGTFGAGLAMLDTKGDLQLYSKQDSIKARDINDIDEDGEGNIWIATEGDGFFKFADNTFTQVGSQENLISPYIKGIQYDPQGRIWYSYRKGIGFFDLESLKKRHFTAQDGLVSTEAYSSLIMVDSKSNKWFCNDYGVTLFENDTLRNSRRQLETFLTGIRIFFRDLPGHLQEENTLNRSMVSELPALKLSHEENHITFDFAAIDLNRSGKIYYRHMLQEYDEEWTPAQTSNSITYTNLDPGDYTLKIQATDDLGSWVDPITEYSFTIDPPFWRETWFYLLQIVGVLTLFMLTYFIGKKGIATKRYVLRLMLFSSFFITLEYVENFVDPLVSDFFGGAPVFRFFLNFILALLLLPVESVITHWMMHDKKQSEELAMASSPAATEDLEAASDPVEVEEGTEEETLNKVTAKD